MASHIPCQCTHCGAWYGGPDRDLWQPGCWSSDYAIDIYGNGWTRAGKRGGHLPWRRLTPLRDGRVKAYDADGVDVAIMTRKALTEWFGLTAEVEPEELMDETGSGWIELDDDGIERRNVNGFSKFYAASADGVVWSSTSGEWVALRVSPSRGTVQLADDEGSACRVRPATFCALAWPEIAQEVRRAALDRAPEREEASEEASEASEPGVDRHHAQVAAWRWGSEVVADILGLSVRELDSVVAGRSTFPDMTRALERLHAVCIGADLGWEECVSADAVIRDGRGKSLTWIAWGPR